jgi:hypothetical protein
LLWVLLSAQIAGKLTSIQFHTMKRILYREVIHIDGTAYTIGTLDFSSSVKEAIEDGSCDNNSNDIIEYVLEELRTNP